MGADKHIANVAGDAIGQGVSGSHNIIGKNVTIQQNILVLPEDLMDVLKKINQTGLAVNTQTDIKDSKFQEEQVVKQYVHDLLDLQRSENSKAGKKTDKIKAGEEEISQIDLLVKDAIIRGNEYYSKGQYYDSVEWYGKALQIDPNNATAMFNLSNAYTFLGEIDKAIKHLGKALKIDPKLGFKSGDRRETIEYRDKSMAVDPSRTPQLDETDFSALEQKSEAQIQQLKTGSLPILLLRQLLSNTFEIGNNYLLKNDYANAMKWFEIAISIDPNCDGLFPSYPWSGKGDVFYELGRYEEAIQAYDKAIDISKSSVYDKGITDTLERKVDALEKLGDALEKLGRYEEADEVERKEAEVSLEIDEEYIKYYDSVLRHNPKDANAWRLKGCAFYSLRKYPEAIKSFDKAIELDPKDASAWNNKGSALQKLAKDQEANECFIKAKELGQNS